jgi:hypothetical protein
VREIVIVIPDLYLPREANGAAAAALLGGGRFPGMQQAGRFGERAVLAAGWRAWLTGLLGHAELAAVAPGRVAAALLGDGAAQEEGVTHWIATPLQLTAGLSRVHLDHRGILRLSDAELAELAASFAATFGGDGNSLAPLPSGDLLLKTPGVTPLATLEPARCAGSDLAEALPQGAAARPLRRLVAEIEMWLHADKLNEARLQRREPPVTTLWLWGAAGRACPTPRVDPPPELPLGYGRDAWLQGLWHLLGGAAWALPAKLDELLAEESVPRAVLVAEVAAELQRTPERSFAEAVAHLDERFVVPALAALGAGQLSQATMVVNDVCMRLGRASRFKLWRRRRTGLASFA